MSIPSAILREYLTRASEEQLGLVLEVKNTHRVMLELHAARGPAVLSDLMICLPSIENTIMIVKKSVELDP